MRLYHFPLVVWFTTCELRWCSFMTFIMVGPPPSYFVPICEENQKLILYLLLPRNFLYYTFFSLLEETFLKYVCNKILIIIIFYLAGDI